MDDFSNLYTCQFCNFQTSKKTKLNIHNRSHTGERPFACKFDGCNKRFFRKEHLQNHAYTHNNERNNICTICSAKFTTSSQLIRHKRKIHDRINFKHSCPNCNLKFRLLTELRDHMKSIHNLFVFRCEVGIKSFYE